jgi:hypothetical protein
MAANPKVSLPNEFRDAAKLRDAIRVLFHLTPEKYVALVRRIPDILRSPNPHAQTFARQVYETIAGPRIPGHPDVAQALVDLIPALFPTHPDFAFELAYYLVLGPDKRTATLMADHVQTLIARDPLRGRRILDTISPKAQSADCAEKKEKEKAAATKVKMRIRVGVGATESSFSVQDKKNLDREIYQRHIDAAQGKVNAALGVLGLA